MTEIETTPQKGSAEWLLVKPIVMSRKMTTWKPGLKFQPEVVNDPTRPDEKGTPGRFPKVGTQLQKGDFQKKNKLSDAPNLLSVVTATPAMKEKAKADAKAWQIKIEEYRKFKNSRTVVKKQPLKQPRSQWQNMIVNSSHGKKSKPSSIGSKKKKSKSTGDIAIADWKAAYQDILSPNSGNRRYVARRDLAAPEKVFSPKKKVRAKARSASASIFSQALPLVGTSSDAQSRNNDTLVGEPEDASVFSRSSTRKPPLKIDFSSQVVQPETDLSTAAHNSFGSREYSDGMITKLPTLVSPISERDEQEMSNDNANGKHILLGSNPPSTPFRSLQSTDVRQVKTGHEDGFVDFEDFDDANDTDEMKQDGLSEKTNSLESHLPLDAKVDDTDLSTDETPPMRIAGTLPTKKESPAAIQTPIKSKKLILEFSMPALTGEPETGDENGTGLEVPVDVYSYGDISSVGSWPSIESEDSYETRMNKMMQRWMDVNGGGEENNLVHDNGIQLDDNVLDHIVLAAPDLDIAMEQFQELTGIMPTHVGPLQGLGAKTAHVGLDNNRYIEILAPDDDDPGPLGDELKCLEEGNLTPYHYAIRSSEVSRLIEGYVYDVLGWDPDHIAMVQALPDESLRQWDLLTMYGHDMGGVSPYYVRWTDPTHHPTAQIPVQAKLMACRVVAPENHDVHKLITGVNGIEIENGTPRLECVLETQNGTITFAADKPKGLVFPGYDEEY